MSVVDIHPEDLLDKLVRGELSPAERDHLETHLEECAVCRMELDMRRDFQLEAATLELPRIPESVRPQLGPSTAGVRRRRAPRALIWGIVAAGFVTATAAVASVITGKLPWPLHLVGNPPPVQVQKPASPAAAKQADSSRNTGSDDVSLPTEPAEDTELAEDTEPAEHGARTSSGSSARPEPPTTAESLFKTANGARRRGQLASAARLYGKLQAQFPTSEEASLSRITFAQLQLDSGNAAAALASFNQYLSRGGPLAAEALVGRASALRQLGLTEQEGRAWRAVVRKYPRSPYARRARERLSVLSAR